MSRNKYYLIIPIVLVFFNELSLPQNYWEVINSPTSELLRNLSAVDENYVWAAGTNGTIIRTTNGGGNWVLLNSGITTAIYDIFFLNRNLGWAVTFPFDPPYYTRILKTTNSGDSWTISQYPQEFAQFRTIHFIDSLNGFLGGSRIERTSDGGNTWHSVNIDSNAVSNYPVIRFKFYDENIGYACGGQRDQAGVMWRTTDGGFNWFAAGMSPDEIFDFHIFDAQNVIALSGDPEWIYPLELVRTTNAGIEWTSVPTEHYALSFALDFRTPQEGWSASGFFFLFSSDGGNNWDTINTPGQTAILDLQFVNDTLGFACGQDGALLRYVKSSPIIIPYDTTVTQLFQNYPNPFNEKTNIEYYLVENSFVRIEMFNSIGQRVQSLINQFIEKGHHRIEFTDNSLASGVYLYTLTAGEIINTKKMLIVR